MTPEEFEPLGYFMGYDKQIDAWGVTHWWSDNHNGTAKYIGLVDTKTFLTPAECYEALERLVENGYRVCLEGSAFEGGFTLDVRFQYAKLVESDCFTTIHEAIEQALLALIAAEGGKE